MKPMDSVNRKPINLELNGCESIVKKSELTFI